jgi:predicted PhzF superfamily epimerase YddE/YHI9
VPTLHILRVFTDEAGLRGNPLGVFLDGGAVPDDRRQELAHDLGFSETVFVDDPRRGEIRIFTPGLELPFAGHPVVGTAWLLDAEGVAVDVLRPPAGEVEVRREGEVTFVAARAEWSPPWELIQVAEPARIDALDGPPGGRRDEVYLWSWLDEDAGLVRSRCWSLADGVGEDEATGSAAIMLAAALERELTIRQGRGSLLHAGFLGEGRAEVGGLVVVEDVREHALPS